MLPKQSVLAHLFDSELTARRFLRNHGVFYGARPCSACDNEMTFFERRNRYVCKRKACRKNVSLYFGTIFYNSRLKCNRILFIAYLWLAKCSFSSIVTLTGHSKRTVANVLDNIRDMIASAFNHDDVVIGGPGIIVEVDESKFGKRKYNRGHRVEGVWVVGGIERTGLKRVFLATVEARNGETLMALLGRHVAPGSILHTDMWRGYMGAEEALQVEHHMVNHTINFVAPDGTHTNTIEGLWNGIKLNIAPRDRTREKINDHLMEFVWRKRHKDDLWGGFMEAMRTIHFE